MNNTPNTALQRTRVRPAGGRSPLSLKPLGHRSQICAILFLGLLQVTAGIAIPANREGTPTPSANQPPDARRARRIAEEAFLKYTSRSVKTYSVKQVGDGGSHWEFFIQGTKRFARPGYHWIVKVNRESGAATVVAGE